MENENQIQLANDHHARMADLSESSNISNLEEAALIVAQWQEERRLMMKKIKAPSRLRNLAEFVLGVGFGFGVGLGLIGCGVVIGLGARVRVKV